jgi:tetratricopeptide (TPR) repeat protein/transcriptional regulator with XRE-family HTH domain
MPTGSGADEPGPWLRLRRQTAGLTREELADRSGVSVRAISDLELGRTRKPYPRSIRRLAGALGLSGAAGDELVARFRADRDADAPGSGSPDQDPPAAPLPPSARAQPPAGSVPAVLPRQLPAVVPRQLPAAVAHFAGRAAELKTLDRLLEKAGPGGTVVISAIGGTAGVGKTALAVHWAHHVAGKFPDGQLYVNLRGFDRSGQPVTPAEAIRGFLDALRVPGEVIPVGLEAQAGLYRSLVAGKRMLVVLDNARDPAQVRPLLPGSPESLVVVTSRSQLIGLVAAEAAVPISLDVLTVAEARELMDGRLGSERAAGEPEAVTDLIELCASLPLALAVAAARAASSPALPLAVLAAELREARERLDLLATGDPATDVQAVFSWSYQNLDGATARMFRLLGLHAGPDISLAATASLAGIAVTDARTTLKELAKAHLLAEHVPGRFAFHDLLRAYAVQLAAARADAPDRRAAIGRSLDHYLHTGHLAAMLLDPFRDRLALDLPTAGAVPERLADYEQALAWFEAEHKVIMAAITQAADTGFYAQAVNLPATLTDFLYLRGHWHDMTATQRTALAAARCVSDQAGEALAHRHLARGEALTGNYGKASSHYQQALDLYRLLGDHVGQARSHCGLAWICIRHGRDDAALERSEQALAQFRAAGHRIGEAYVLNEVGWCHARLGGYQLAITHCQQALHLSREIGDRHTEAATWDSLGYVHHHLGDHQQAVTCYQHALAMFRDLGDRFNEGATFANLGDTHQAAGDLLAAGDAWQQALDMLRDLSQSDADQVRAKIQGQILTAPVNDFPS